MISQRTKKKVLEGKYIKANPDVFKEIKRRVKKGIFPSENSAINLTLEKEFLPIKNNGHAKDNQKDS